MRPPLAASAPAVSVPAVVGICALALLCWLALQRALAFGPASAPTIVDFDVFDLAGRLAREGRLRDAYAMATLQTLEAQLSPDATRSIPFAYPPPFALAMAALSRLPTSVAYAVFEMSSFAALAIALRRASRHAFWPVMLAMLPAVFVNVVAGQNGMLTAGLAGLAASLEAQRGSAAAGALAGLLAALKPQSALGLPMLFAGLRDWRAGLAMAATGGALVGLSLIVLGPAILPAFLGALGETSRLLGEGRFPLHRMTSVYAFARGLGAAADAAMTVHVTLACMVLGAAALVARGRDARVGAGLALCGACFLSPYFYDYDLAVVGLGLALLGPALVAAGRRGCFAWSLCLLALAEGAGSVEALALPVRLSLGAPLLLAGLAPVALALAKGDPARRGAPGLARPPLEGADACPPGHAA